MELSSFFREATTGVGWVIEDCRKLLPQRL